MSNGGAQHWSHQFIDGNGNPYSGVKVYHTSAGTDTLKNVWTDEGKVTPDANPVVGDSRGMVSFYADGDYKLVIKDSADVTLYTWDNVKITSDTATLWEGNAGTAYPTAATANRWQQFLKHDASNNMLALGVNTGTAFKDITHGIYAHMFSSFTDAVTAADGKTLIIMDSITLPSGAITIPATVLGVLVIAPGIIAKGSATSLTINAPVVGNPMHQWLSGFAAGGVTFGSGSVTNVLPRWVGAKGDGSTNDSTAINVALAAFKNVYMDGTIDTIYMAELLAIPTKCKLWGNGATIRQRGTTNPLLTTSVELTSVDIFGLVFDGASASQIGINFNIAATIDMVSIHNNLFKNFAQAAIYLKGTGTLELARNIITENRFNTCSPAIKLENSLSTLISTNIFHHTSATTDAIYIENSAEDIIITGNKFQGSSTGGGIYAHNGGFVSIVGNSMRVAQYAVKLYDNENSLVNNNEFIGDFGGDIIKLDGTATSNRYITISGNNMYGMTPGTPANGAGIKIEGSVNNLSITGNTILEVDDGIDISTTAAVSYNITITGNTIRNCDLEGITTQGNHIANLVIANNVIQSCQKSGIRHTLGQGAVIMGNSVQDCNLSNDAAHAGIKYTPASMQRHIIKNNAIYGVSINPISSGFVTFGSADTTPSILYGNLFRTSGTPTITMFDDGLINQEITIICDSAVVFDFTGTNLKGNNGVDYTATVDDRITATYDGTNWYCTIG